MDEGNVITTASNRMLLRSVQELDLTFFTTSHGLWYDKELILLSSMAVIDKDKHM